MKQLLIIITTLVIVTACGGGGSESSEAIIPSSSSNDTNTGTTSGSQVTKTSDLVTSDEFDFGSNYVLQITLPAKVDANSYFINICTDFNANAPIVTNYTSCKVRTYLNDTTRSFALDLSHSEKQLVVQIWPIYEGGEVITRYFTASGDNQTWQIEP